MPHIFGDRKFVEIPGEESFELPPLLVHTPSTTKLGRVMIMAEKVTEVDDLVPTTDLDLVAGEAQAQQRRMELAVNLVEAYVQIIHWWHWGNGILEWIRQCETTFASRSQLRLLLYENIWPHAGRSSFVTLLEDKAVSTDRAFIENAVGLRLAFRQPPPLSCFSDQFLFYLNGPLAETAYQRWAEMNPAPVSDLPPERFNFQVVTL